MSKVISLNDETSVMLDKLRHKYRNPINDRPASYSFAIISIVRKNKRLMRKLKLKESEAINEQQ